MITYQILARFWNGTDVHRFPLNGVDEASFSHSDGTDDMNPPGSREDDIIKIQAFEDPTETGR